MTRNCLNVMQKFASLAKYADNPSKYKSRRDWVLNSQLYKTLPDADRVQALNDDWDDWEHEQQMTNYARRTGQSTNNMTGTFRGGRMTQFNGQPVSTNVNQSNPKNELPRQWFDNAGYTKDEYNKYKGRGYSLHPVTRERMIHTWIARDRKVNKMRQHAESTGQPTDNTTATFSGGRMTQFNGRPVSTNVNQNTKPLAGSSTTNAVDTNRPNTATVQTPTVAPGHSTAPKPAPAPKPAAAPKPAPVPVQKPVQKPAESWIKSKVSPNSTEEPVSIPEEMPEEIFAFDGEDYSDYKDPEPAQNPAKSWVDSKVNQEYTDVHPIPTAPMSVDEIYQDPEPATKPVPEDKGLDMSGFSLAGLGSNSTLDRVPEHLRSSGGYQPGPAKLKEVDINSLF